MYKYASMHMWISTMLDGFILGEIQTCNNVKLTFHVKYSPAKNLDV